MKPVRCLLPLLVAAVSAPWLSADTVPRTGSKVWSYDTNLSITCNSNWGGACVSVTWKGTEFVDDWDAGRQAQLASYIGYNGSAFTPWNDTGTPTAVYFPAGKTPNPTECGDEQWQRLSLPSPTDYWSAGASTITSYTRSREFWWRNYMSTNLGHVFAPVFGAKDLLKKTLWVPGSSYGLNNVVKFESWVKNPTQGDLHAEIPALYTLYAYRNFIGFDVTTGQQTNVAAGANYNPVAGGIIAYDGNVNNRCIALYGSTNGLNPSWKFQTGAFSDCAKIRANGFWKNTATGGVIYGYCFLIVGDNVQHVKNTMTNLYARGWK